MKQSKEVCLSSRHDEAISEQLSNSEFNKIPACGVFLKNDASASVNCNSCRSFHRCCVNRGITHCYECTIYPCSKFKSFAKDWMKKGQDLKLNQKFLEVMGEKYFKANYEDRLKKI